MASFLIALYLKKYGFKVQGQTRPVQPVEQLFEDFQVFWEILARSGWGWVKLFFGLKNINLIKNWQWLC